MDPAATKAAENVPKAAAEKAPPYTYPAPVKGHIRELNVGEFDLVDGIAYSVREGRGTVVYVSSKPIASPMLVDSACPLLQALALSKLRNASFGEVTLEDSGHSKYFAVGRAFGVRLTDQTPGGWSSASSMDARRVAGSVVHRRYGRFEFKLPLSDPKVDELTYGDREAKRKVAAGTPTPSDEAVTAAYVALRDAALRNDLQATLAVMGFDERQSTAIRGLEGIDADFRVFAARFVSPGTPGEPWTRPGSGQVRGEGFNAGGRPYFNDYYFDLCGDRLVLTGIVEQSP